MSVAIVDASTFITLAEIGHLDCLRSFDHSIAMPSAVADEIETDPAARRLSSADWVAVLDRPATDVTEQARSRLGTETSGGDTALLAAALARRDDDPVAVTDDKPLRSACKSLGIAVSGTIGVLVIAVENGHLDADTARDALVAMDEVGAHLSIGLLRRAERLIEDAADEE
jgi:predicted nucleic acid-binding protein